MCVVRYYFCKTWLDEGRVLRLAEAADCQACEFNILRSFGELKQYDELLKKQGIRPLA